MGFVLFGLNRREKSLLAENVRPQPNGGERGTLGYFYLYLACARSIYIAETGA